jgi:hypothetical protein
MSISLQADSLQPQGYILINGVPVVTVTLSGISTVGNINGWNVVNTNSALSLASKNIINTQNTTLTCTLPSGPNPGDWVQVADAAGTWGTNRLVLVGNGTPILSSLANFDCDISNERLELIYINSSIGWQINV